MSETDRYFKSVKTSFQVMGKKEREYLGSLKILLEEAENLSYEECIEIYGDPKDIVAAYYEHSDGTLLKKLKYRKYITIIIVIMIIVAFARIFMIYKAYLDSKSTVPDRVEIIIGEE